MTEMLKSIIMGLGCLSLLGMVSCGMMGAGVMVAADKVAEQEARDRASGDSDRDAWRPKRDEEDPWAK